MYSDFCINAAVRVAKIDLQNAFKRNEKIFWCVYDMCSCQINVFIKCLLSERVFVLICVCLWEKRWLRDFKAINLLAWGHTQGERHVSRIKTIILIAWHSHIFKFNGVHVCVSILNIIYVWFYQASACSVRLASFLFLHSSMFAGARFLFASHFHSFICLFLPQNEFISNLLRLDKTF